MKNNIKLVIALALTLSLSCTKIEDKPIVTPDKVRAIVISEGQFGYGTGSMTTLSHDNIVVQDVFKTINSRPLGDVPQSLTQIGDNYYIPVNNSRKVEVINSKTYASVETMVLDYNVIPMYVAHLGGDSIVVSDQSSSAIAGSESCSSLFILDINHGTDRKIIKRRVQIEAPTFQMKVIKNKLFVGSSTSLIVFDIDDINTDSKREVKNKSGNNVIISDFSKLCLDKNGMLWALTPSSAICIDPNTEKIVNEIGVSNISTRWGNMDIDKSGENLYFNSKNLIFTINIDNPTTPATPIITHSENDEHWTTYTIGVSKENTVFVVRVLFGSITRSRVFEYNLQGEIVNRYLDSNNREQPYFRAGIFSHHIHFL